jgi:uncharacterized membrane-anchored protein YitT (DUF2179 family)
MLKDYFVYSLKVLLGCVIVGVGIIIIHHAHLVTGGTAGLSLSLSYALKIPFSIAFFFVNLPFYILSFIRMGKNFTLSTILAISILSGVTYVDRWLPKFAVAPALGAVFGGLIIGCGVVVLFLTGSSLGGATILALYLQKKVNWDPGKVNFTFDFFVVCTSFFIVGIVDGLYSLLSVFLLGCVISWSKNKINVANNKPSQKAAA